MIARLLTQRWAIAPRLRPVARAVEVLLASVTFYLLCALPAYAAPTAPMSAAAPIAAPGMLRFIDLTDSRKASLWYYQMHIAHGGVTDPGKVIWSFFIELFWTVYLCVVALVIWFLHFVLSFSWLKLLSTPALHIAHSEQILIHKFGLTTLFLTISAVAAVLWMARGKWAGGITELATSLVIASLASGILANPVVLVAGDHGLIIQARDFGLQVAEGLSHDGATTGNPDQMVTNITNSMVDTFIRTPHELINYGTILDHSPCESGYNQTHTPQWWALSTGDLKFTDPVKSCNKTAKQTAEHPGPGTAVSAGLLGPAAFLLMVFALLLAGAVLVAAVTAIYQAAKSIWALLTGLLPGSARGSLWMTVAETIMALVLIVFSVIFLMAYLLLLQGVFTDHTNATEPMVGFLIVDALMVAGIVIYWKARANIRRAAERLAKVLATRPQTGPTALPARRSPVPLTQRATQVRATGQAIGAIGANASTALRGGMSAARSVGQFNSKVITAGVGAPVAAGLAAVNYLKSRRSTRSGSLGTYSPAPTPTPTPEPRADHLRPTPVPTPTPTADPAAQLSGPSAATTGSQLAARAQQPPTTVQVYRAPAPAARYLRNLRFVRRQAVLQQLSSDSYAPVRASNGREVLVSAPTRPAIAAAGRDATHPGPRPAVQRALPLRGRIPAALASAPATPSVRQPALAGPATTTPHASD